MTQQLLLIPHTCSSLVAQLYLRDYYETYYGINTHEKGKSKDAIPMIAYCEAEDSFETSYLRERITRYRKSGVHDCFHIPWDRFIELPKEICDALMQEAEYALLEKAKDTDALKREVERGLR